MKYSGPSTNEWPNVRIFLGTSRRASDFFAFSNERKSKYEFGLFNGYHSQRASDLKSSVIVFVFCVTFTFTYKKDDEY